MTAPSWHDRIDHWRGLLSGISVREARGTEVSPDDAFAAWLRATLRLRSARGTIYLVGNGASASMASHFAADLAKNARVHTQVFSDLSLITAISNDMGYELVFAEPLRRRAEPGDMLVAVSSSGRSPNVLAAVEVARELALDVVTLSAMSADNPLRSKGMLNFWVAASDYGDAETCHAAILHQWMDLVSAAGE